MFVPNLVQFWNKKGEKKSFSFKLFFFRFLTQLMINLRENDFSDIKDERQIYQKKSNHKSAEAFLFIYK